MPILWAIQAIFQIVATILYEAKSFYSANGSILVVGFNVVEDHFFTSIATATLVLAAAVDVQIAIAMTFLLLRQRSAGFASTSHILQRLAMFAINTGFWTATFAVMSAIFTAVYRSNALSAVFSVPLSSVYCNTLLANLNARAYIRSEPTTHTTSVGTELVAMPPPTSIDTKTKDLSEKTKINPSAHLNIRKTTEVVTFTDAKRLTTPENLV
jgi:hypothetical protein